MDRGFYVSLSAMMSGTKKINDVANNIANINTTGYKKDVSVIEEFNDIMINKLNDNKNLGYMSNQVYINDTYTQFKDGSLVNTKVETDYSITGEGFFKIEKNGEFVYTRDGSFNVDIEGYLVTKDGGYVLNKNGERLRHSKNEDQSSDFLIVTFDNIRTLKKTDSGYYSNAFGIGTEQVDGESVIRQGYVEMSNVDAADELTDLIKFQRYFQFNQRAMEVHDELLKKISEF